MSRQHTTITLEEYSQLEDQIVREDPVQNGKEILTCDGKKYLLLDPSCEISVFPEGLTSDVNAELTMFHIGKHEILNPNAPEKAIIFIPYSSQETNNSQDVHERRRRDLTMSPNLVVDNWSLFEQDMEIVRNPVPYPKNTSFISKTSLPTLQLLAEQLETIRSHLQRREADEQFDATINTDMPNESLTSLSGILQDDFTPKCGIIKLPDEN